MVGPSSEITQKISTRKDSYKDINTYINNSLMPQAPKNTIPYNYHKLKTHFFPICETYCI